MAIDALLRLTGLPVQNGINAADFLKGVAPTAPIGNLTTTQVQGLMAQAKATANQLPNVVSATNGIGQYGMSPQQLEAAGFLKPGTVSTYLKDPAQLQSVLSSPAVWTGKDGVGSLTSFLGNSDKQAAALQSSLSSSFNSLSKQGALNGVVNPTDVGSLLQVASKFGVNDAIAFTRGQSPAAIAGQIQNVAKSAQFAINFTDTKLPAGLKGEVEGKTFYEKVDRTSVDTAAQSILGSTKIPSPDYKTNPRDKLRAQQEAIDDVERAKANYEKVLKANGGNRSAPEVQEAYAEFKAANDRLQKL